MTDDEVFAEFYFTTVVIPTWRDVPGYKEFSEVLNTYYALPGSNVLRLEQFIRKYTWEQTRDIREGRNLYDRR